VILLGSKVASSCESRAQIASPKGVTRGNERLCEIALLAQGQRPPRSASNEKVREDVHGSEPGISSLEVFAVKKIIGGMAVGLSSSKWLYKLRIEVKT